MTIRAGNGVAVLVDQNKPEIVLWIAARADDFDGETVFAGRGEDVYAAGLHGRAGLVGVPATMVECALRTKLAWARAQPQGFVEAGQKNLPLQLHRDLLGSVGRCLKEDAVIILVQHPASLVGRRRVWGAHPVGVEAVAAELALPADPAPGDDVPGADKLGAESAET